MSTDTSKLAQAEEFVRELQERKLIKDITDIHSFASILASGKKIYFGIDPTASSLHLGHYLGLSIVKRFAKKKYKVVLLIGGLTALIGDPSFRTAARPELRDVGENISSIRNFLERFFSKEIEDKTVEIVNNYELHNDFLLQNTPLLQQHPLQVVVDFVEKICSKLTVNELLEKESIQSRRNQGLRVSEFLYSVLQGWDFVRLYEDKDVRIQMGGQDQWGNLLVGLNLISKTFPFNENERVYAGAFTFPLLVDKEGNKIGKSTGNAIFLQDDKDSSYHLYQYFLNLDDSIVRDYFLLFSFLPIDQILGICNSDIREAKKKLASSVCDDIFGSNKSKTFHKTEALSVFSTKLLVPKNYSELKKLFDTVPSYSRAWVEGISLSVLFQELGLVESKSEFKRLCLQNGIHVSGVDSRALIDGNYKIQATDICWNPDENIEIKDGYLLVRKGQKQPGVIRFTIIP